MRRYSLLIGVIFVIVLAILRTPPSTPVQAAPLALGGGTPTSTSTSTPSPTKTATSTTTQTSTQTQTPTQTLTPSETPTIGILFPIIVKVPTLTPSKTSTPTPTWTPSQTFTPSKTPTTFTCNGRFDGFIALEDSKPTYATHIENVKFLQSVHNNNNSSTCFGILGFDAIRPDNSHMQFNSQWSASGVPSKFLTIFANCWGPNGQPCAGSQNTGQQEDHVGTNPGEHSPWEIDTPGNYTVNYYVCYSNYNDCQKTGANWAQLGGIQFTAIDWTPSAPSGTEVSPTPTPPTTETTQPVCYLITNDPAGIYLSCDTPHLKERQLFRH